VVLATRLDGTAGVYHHAAAEAKHASKTDLQGQAQYYSEVSLPGMRHTGEVGSEDQGKAHRRAHVRLIPTAAKQQAHTHS